MNKIKCSICGRFIKSAQIGTKKIKCNYTPDSQYTVETIEYYHAKCDKGR